MYILPARQSYNSQYSKMAFSVLAVPIARLHNRWIGRGGAKEWTSRSPDMTSMDFFLLGFMKGNVYVSPLPTTLQELKTRIRETCENNDQEILQRVAGG
jgi:hypothetical protein